MCGRYSFVVGPDAASQIGTLELRYGAQWRGGDLESARPRYNIAPTQKVPVWFSLAGGDQFAFAGLWTKWKQDGQDHVGCVIITTAPNDLVAPIHNRMPAILLDGRARRWLDGPDDLVTESWLTEHLAPVDSVKMTARIVSTAVNSPKRDDPSCREAA